jgi:hypothetical protein
MDNNTNNIIGYYGSRIGQKYSIPVLVTIEIPKNAITDIQRENIVDPLNATYSTNTLKIIKIIDEELNEYSICRIHANEYKIGEVVLKNEGELLFYLSKKRAVPNKYSHSGNIVTYYENGQKEEEFMLNEKKNRHGVSKIWSENGVLLKSDYYLNGNLHGESKEWDKNEILISHLLFDNGNIIEYLNSDLAKETIDRIYNKRMEYIERILFKNKKNENLKMLIHEYFISLKHLNKVIVKNNEVTYYNFLKKIDLIKKLHDAMNTLNGKLFLNTNLDYKDDIVEQIDELIEQIDKTDPQYHEWNTWLDNIKEIYKNFIF